MRQHRLSCVLLLTILVAAAMPVLASAAPGPVPTDPNSDAGAPQGGPAGIAWPGPDGFGYTGESAPYQWVEISATGTRVLVGDDDLVGPLPIGFRFNFYGSDYTDFYVSSNGFISFGPGSAELSNDCILPDPTPPDRIIALMWDDLDPGDTGDPIYYQTFDTCPVGGGVCLVVQYEGFCHYPGGANCTPAGTWEALLFASGDIVLQFRDGGAEMGAGSTTGIEGGNPAARQGLVYACNSAGTISDGLAIRFRFPRGVLPVPEAASRQGCARSSVEHRLVLCNDTGADASFALGYAAGWKTVGPPEVFAANGSCVPFIVSVDIPCGGASDTAIVTATGNGVSDSSALTTSATAGGVRAWERIAPLAVARSRPAAAAVDGKVYVLGGETPDGGRAAQVERFDPASGLWTTMSGRMPTPVSNACAAAIGPDIYVAGGSAGAGVSSDSVQVYHTGSDSWETLMSDPLPEARSGPGCAALDGKLYVFGGIAHDGSYTNSAYAYDPGAPAGSRWGALPAMLHARAYLGSAAVRGKLWAVGGRDAAASDLDWVEAYDPADGAWHGVTRLGQARGGPAAFAWGDSLVVCGGGWSAYGASCEVYDTAQGYSGAWRALEAALTTGRRTFAYASLPQGLYALAGYNGTYLAASERLPILACEACELTMHVSEILGYFALDPYGHTVLRMYVRVHDGDHLPLGDVVVEATISYPPGRTAARTRTSQWNGMARFHWGAKESGVWTLCVERLTRPGYQYVPADNDVPVCATWTN